MKYPLDYMQAGRREVDMNRIRDEPLTDSVWTRGGHADV
nr:MAG TPA: hypothetical protein [Caudoviricetes sp.]